MTIQTSTGTKVTAIPSDAPVMGTGAESMPVTMAAGSLPIAFAVKYRRVNAEARTAEGQVPALPRPKRPAPEFVYTAPKKQSATVAACATCD